MAKSLEVGADIVELNMYVQTCPTMLKYLQGIMKPVQSVPVSLGQQADAVAEIVREIKAIKYLSL